jgi:hypothetical protein
MPCGKKARGKTCDFELKAVRPDLKSGKIHIYAHSEHNHPVESEGKVFFWFYLIYKKNYRKEIALYKDEGVDAGCKSSKDLQHSGQH